MFETRRHAPRPAPAWHLPSTAGLAIILTLGCGGTPRTADRPGDQPGSLAGLSSRHGTIEQRIARMRQTWLATTEPTDRPAARQRLKDVAWSNAEPFEVRAAAVELLADDSDPAGVHDTREMVKLLLPRERSRGMVAMLSRLCVDRGWQDATPALVRSYSRVIDEVAEDDRSERWAIERLNPGVSLTDVAFGVFLDPKTDPGPAGAEFDRRARADAWAVLARLDPTGARRRSMLAGVSTQSPDVALMRRCAEQFGAMPDSAAEVEWARSLLDDGPGANAAANRAWRTEVAPAVAGLDAARRERLAIRHLEPIRWAAAHEPRWLQASRQELLSEIATRLAPRPTFQRRIERDREGGLRPERLADWQDQLSWGDALSILVIDTVIADPRFLEPLWVMLDQDRADRTTEYGGLVQHSDRAGGVVPVLFVPRPAAREGDMAFPAPEDMIRQGDRALAVFHFHASELQMSEHAGPSAGDLRFARTSGRNCVVFTSLRSRRLAADYFQPDGAVIDLGDLPR